MAKEREPSASPVVGNRAKDRLAMFDEIANGYEQVRAKEEEEDEDETDENAAPDNSPAPVETPDDENPDAIHVDEAKEQPKAELITRKVNGKEVSLTSEEWITRGMKVESADAYLREAAEKAKQVQAEPPKSAPVVEEDYEAAATALQMGTTQEAATVLRNLAKRPSSDDAIEQKVAAYLAFQQAATQFQTEFKEIASDPYLMRLAMEEDSRLIQSGDQRPYGERFKSIGEGLRTWVGKLKVPATQDEKLKRKATVTPINAASARAISTTEQEPDDDTQTIIANMAKKRGQVVS